MTEALMLALETRVKRLESCIRQVRRVATHHYRRGRNFKGDLTGDLRAIEKLVNDAEPPRVTAAPARRQQPSPYSQPEHHGVGDNPEPCEHCGALDHIAVHCPAVAAPTEEGDQL